MGVNSPTETAVTYPCQVSSTGCRSFAGVAFFHWYGGFGLALVTSTLNRYGSGDSP